jgi:hypothetical protein
LNLVFFLLFCFASFPRHFYSFLISCLYYPLPFFPFSSSSCHASFLSIPPFTHLLTIPPFFPLPHRSLRYLLVPSCCLFSVLSLPHPLILFPFLFYFFLILSCFLSSFLSCVILYCFFQFLSYVIFIIHSVIFFQSSNNPSFLSYNIPHPFRYILFLLPSCFLFSVLSLPHPLMILSFLL